MRRRGGGASGPEQDVYLFEGRQLGRVLDVSQAGALSRQLLRDPLVLWMLRGQDQAGMVAQLPQVLQRLRERRRVRGRGRDETEIREEGREEKGLKETPPGKRVPWP